MAAVQSKKSLKAVGKVPAAKHIIHDLELIYQAAFESGNFTAALKAKELQMRERKISPEEQDFWSQLNHLTDSELKSILENYKKKQRHKLVFVIFMKVGKQELFKT